MPVQPARPAPPESGSVGLVAVRVAELMVGTNLHSAYLAAYGLGQFLYKFHHTRILVGSRSGLDMTLEFLYKSLLIASAILLGEHHRGLHKLPAHRIGHTGYGTFHHRRMTQTDRYDSQMT